MRYRWVMHATDRASLPPAQQHLPALTLRNLSVGAHVFGLELTNAADMTARAANLTVGHTCIMLSC